jgi:hypothetical protein
VEKLLLVQGVLGAGVLTFPSLDAGLEHAEDVILEGGQAGTAGAEGVADCQLLKLPQPQPSSSPSGQLLPPAANRDVTFGKPPSISLRSVPVDADASTTDQTY